MQLLQLLTEQADRQQEVVELMYAIRQAKPFFDQTADDPAAWLYRGINRSETPTTLSGVISPRADRQPLDTPLQIHTMLDNRLYQDFGIKYRSNSMFVTGDRAFAGDYGALCIVLPLGPFKYAYGKNVRDAYGEFRAQKLRASIIESPEGQSADLTELMEIESDTKWCAKQIMDFVDKHPHLHPVRDRWFEETYKLCGYVSPPNIMEGLLSGNEIMLHAAKMAIIPVQRNVHPDVIETAERYLNARFELDTDQGTPSTIQFLNMILEPGRIFK